MAQCCRADLKCSSTPRAMVRARVAPTTRSQGACMNWHELAFRQLSVTQVVDRIREARERRADHRVRIARDELCRIRDLPRPSTRRVRHRPIWSQRSLRKAPSLLRASDCGQVVGEIAGADRFHRDAKLDRGQRAWRDPVSSGRHDRRPSRRGGNPSSMRRFTRRDHRSRCNPKRRPTRAQRAEGRPTRGDRCPGDTSSATSAAHRTPHTPGHLHISILT